MGRLDPDFTSDGIYGPDDLSAMSAAFRAACIKLGGLAEDRQVRHVVAFVVAHHYELGIRQPLDIVAAAFRTGHVVGAQSPNRTTTFFG